jgi:hypothetical protein
MKVNGITQDFNTKVQALINDGKEPEEIVAALDWGATPFSLVRNSKRNVPPEKYDLLLNKFALKRDDNTMIVKDLEERHVHRLEEELKHAREHIVLQRELIRSNLATMLENQSVALALMEAAVEVFSKYVADGNEDLKKRIRTDLYIASLGKLSAARKRGNRSELDIEDIVFEKRDS